MLQQIQNFICSVKFKNNFFDAVFLFGNVFEQIPSKKERIKALKNIYRMLKQDGILILTTQSVFSFDLKLRILMIYQFFKYKLFKNIRNFEFGDLILKDETDVFIHISNPFLIKKILKKLDLKY